MKLIIHKQYFLFTPVTLFPIRRLTSKEAGYVPANYVKEIEPRTVKKVTKQKVIVPEKVIVKRKVKKKVKVQRQRAVQAKTPEKKGVQATSQCISLSTLIKALASLNGHICSILEALGKRN